MQIGTIQELLQNFFGLCHCGGAFYTFVPQTAKGWQPVLLGTNCQPFFIAYAALQRAPCVPGKQGGPPLSRCLLHKGITH